jgi:hypothetical protein
MRSTSVRGRRWSPIGAPRRVLRATVDGGISETGGHMGDDQIKTVRDIVERWESMARQFLATTLPGGTAGDTVIDAIGRMRANEAAALRALLDERDRLERERDELKSAAKAACVALSLWHGHKPRVDVAEMVNREHGGGLSEAYWIMTKLLGVP